MEHQKVISNVREVSKRLTLLDMQTTFSARVVFVIGQ